jgi:hypothetical protein
MMPFEFLPMILAGIFFLILGYVSWLKYREHLHAHRHDHEWRSHHIVSVRKIRKRSRTHSKRGSDSRSKRR